MNLDPSSDDFQRWGHSAVDTAARYVESLRQHRLYPRTTSAQIRQIMDPELPVEPVGFDELLTGFKDLIDFSRQNAHPRMFGYVQSPGTGIAAIADLLASTLNANLTAWRSAPAPVELERLTINWIKQLLGYDKRAAGLFVSGGSMANLAAIAVARTSKAPRFLQTGAAGTNERLCVYVSSETHHSVDKAAALLGIGRENVRKIAVDGSHKIRIDELVARITEDRRAGDTPCCVVANAGTVMTGAVDPFRAIHEVTQQFNLWMHVDAAYGGFAMLSPSARHLFDGIELADSIALDPHKWLYLPIDCGCVLYRDPAAARATFASDAEYTRVIGQEAEEAFAFWDYGPELSRRFRALKVWMVLKGIGVNALGRAIEKDIACARHFEQLVTKSDDFEMLAPVELSIFCFRHVPPELTRARSGANDEELRQIEQQLDLHNEQLMVALQLDGSSYLSNALIGGKFSLRGCVMNYRTTLQDMDILLDDLRRVAKTIG